MGAQRLDVHVSVAAAAFDVGGDRDAAGRFGDRFPPAPGVLDGGEYVCFFDGFGFKRAPDAGELAVAGGGLLVFGGVALVIGSDSVAGRWRYRDMESRARHWPSDSRSTLCRIRLCTWSWGSPSRLVC
jgi:hypothetical protein